MTRKGERPAASVNVPTRIDGCQREILGASLLAEDIAQAAKVTRARVVVALSIVYPPNDSAIASKLPHSSLFFRGGRRGIRRYALTESAIGAPLAPPRRIEE